jgi:hypothetical protein
MMRHGRGLIGLAFVAVLIAPAFAQERGAGRPTPAAVKTDVANGGPAS